MLGFPPFKIKVLLTEPHLQPNIDVDVSFHSLEIDFSGIRLKGIDVPWRILHSGAT